MGPSLGVHPHDSHIFVSSFGLGNRGKIDRVEVRWIGGKVEVFRNIEIDPLITLAEGDS